MAAAALLVLALILALSCGGPGDELAVLDVLVASEDASCERGRCELDGEVVPVDEVLARGIESEDASRHAAGGLFVFTTWESRGAWVELELDLPTDESGQGEPYVRYSEHVDGEPRFVAVGARGRIVLVASPGRSMPYAAYLELRFESDAGEVRRLHLGHLDPEQTPMLDILPPDTPIDWEADGVELIVLVAEVRPARGPIARTGAYEYDYREESDPYVTAFDCTTDGEAWCEADEEEPVAPEDAYGEGCGAEDSSTGCSGDDTGAYGDGSGCGSESFCKGDDYSESDAYAEEPGCSCEDDGSYDDEVSKDLACEGDDETDSSKAFDCDSCDDSTYVSAAEHHRRILIARGRGRPLPNPARRAASFLPVVLAVALTRLLRGARTRRP